MTYRPKLLLTALTLLALLCAGPVAAAPAATPPDVAGTGHLLLDMGSNQVLAAQNIDHKLEPASLTKILTAYVVFREIRNGHISLTDPVLVSEKAWRMEGSRMFIEVGKQVSVEDLLKGLIVASGNDSAVALAEHTAGSEEAFANLMNEHAQRLGMTNSHFVNASGLPHPEHYTTPADIARATIATIREFPEWYAWYADKEYTYNDITQPNRNRLLWRDESVDGVKTGHTSTAGYCLVASAQRDDMRLISVVMGTDSEEERAIETQKLLGYGFRFFENLRLYDAGQTVQQVRVWKGENETLPVGVTESLSLTVPRGEAGGTEARLVLHGTIEAPVSKNQEVGVIEVTNGGEIVRSVPAVALAGVAEAGFLGQMMDSVLMMFE
jgi:D-alanyl-D-alanine carboxypeptidase (penicillin-binding protein 5/6)